MAKHYPVGKAQQTILDALDLEAETFIEAEAVFKEHGLSVVPVRRGRRSVPEVRQLETTGGGFNNGEGETWDIDFKKIDVQKIAEWMVE